MKAVFVIKEDKKSMILMPETDEENRLMVDAGTYKSVRVAVNGRAKGFLKLMLTFKK